MVSPTSPKPGMATSPKATVPEAMGRVAMVFFRGDWPPDSDFGSAAWGWAAGAPEIAVGVARESGDGDGDTLAPARRRSIALALRWLLEIATRTRD